MIFFNWKANGTKELVEKYNSLEIFSKKITAIPPFHLTQLLDFKKFNIGVQDVSTFPNGAYTGEVTCQMLEEANVKFCLVGHSERRHYHSEDNATISKKIKSLLAKNITPILCVGENSLDRANNAHFKVLQSQMEAYEDGCVVAYEPVWAIGTGSTPTNSEINQVVDWLKQQYEHGYDNPKVLYGGSVSSQNIQELSKTNIDGLLVGKASLEIHQVIEISKYF